MTGGVPDTEKMDGGERRGSLGRAFGRLRAAMKRAGSNGKETPTMPSSSGANEVKGSQKDASIAAAATTQSEDVEQPIASLPSATIEAELVAVDDGPADGSDEPLLPLFSSRAGISDEKAKVLFEKYGLLYEPRRSSGEEPASKLRRVEKPIRIRVHWKCHECQGHFARDRTCVSCGHRRCADCTRSPSRRVQDVMGDARITRQQEELQQPATRHEATAPLPTESALSNIPGTAPVEPLVEDDQQDEDDAEPAHSYVYTMPSRPRHGEGYILRPKAQVIRRQCHKCEEQFLPPSRTTCENCNHSRCNLCPRWPPKAHKWPRGSPGDEQAPEEEVKMVRVVQRVYRKPRQRVRYTCDQCQDAFVDRYACRTCGHEKCPNCTRFPPKRLPEVHDPAVLQAVAHRLATYESRRPQVAAAAG